MASYVKHEQFVEDLAFGVHNFTNVGGCALTYWLTDDAPNVATWVDIGDVTNSVTANIGGDGLTSAAFTTSTQTSGTYLLLLPDHEMLATGAVADFRYVGLYNDSAAADQIICHWDYGSTVTGMDSPDTFTVDYTISTFTIA